MNTKKKILGTAVAAALGLVALPQAAYAELVEFDWQGMFTMLDPYGAVLANISIPNYPGNFNNQYQTPVGGTLIFDTDTGAGSATLAPFGFLAGMEPAEVTSFQLQAIGDGQGGQGSLVLGNLLWNWGGNLGMPASLVLDAAGLYGAMTQPGFGYGSVIEGVGAIPAVDGSYVNSVYQYLALGPTPVATTAWNTSLAAGCNYGNCMETLPSGTLPLVLDTAQNITDYVENTGAPAGSWGGLYNEVYGIAGSPMPDGPFTGYNIALDITRLTVSPVCGAGICEVPVPAAVWLFGSGLVGLVGFARRRR